MMLSTDKKLHTFGPKTARWTLFQPHANEKTAHAVAREYVDHASQPSVRLLALLDPGRTRNMTFEFGGSEWEVDPNRMFTRPGAKASVWKYTKREPSDEVLDALLSFADEVLQRVRRDGGPMVTVHNNTNERYSVRSYLEGGDNAADAEAVYVNDKRDEDSFFFTTTRALFNAYSEANENVVLQSKHVGDDGSLSYRCARNSVPYVNIEAQHGRKRENARMLRVGMRVLLEVGPGAAAPA